MDLPVLLAQKIRKSNKTIAQNIPQIAPDDICAIELTPWRFELLLPSAEGDTAPPPPPKMLSFRSAAVGNMESRRFWAELLERGFDMWLQTY